MNADEKLTELKIAYADMILNTAKEAAARIMVSERRALRLELELKQSKEDAIQMLMRLKQMMDSKISEAEMASRAQQKKIEELEAQLQEAEDIVKDLREELSAVQTELERVTPREVNPMLQVYEALEKNVLSNPDGIVFPHVEEQPDIVPPFDIGNSVKDQDNKGQRLHNSLFPLWKSCINDQDLPSIILRSKGTKLYKSGCTHRIRACERTPLDRELSLPEQTNHIRPDMITKVDEGEKLHKALSLGDERKKSRKRASPNTKKRTSCPNLLLDQVKEMDHVSDNSCLTTSRSVKRSKGENPDGSIKIATDLVRVSDVHSRIREELLPVGHEKPPLSSEAQVDPPKSKALETGGVPIQPTSSRVIKYTFQRKRKRGTLSTEGSDLCDLKKKEENKTSPLETEKTISMEESIQEETEKVISIEESTEVGTEKAITMEESTQEETEKVISVEESTEEGAEKVFTMEESTQKETEKVISVEESTQEGTAKVITMEESTEDGTEKLISMEESTQEEIEKIISIEETTQEEKRLEQVAQQLISLSEKVVAMKKQMQIQT
ncbi:uncharacterized protein LOC112511517 [Cynara cardunculus var. scolymus]|nr:uncharacterized protein LOC112511517 [Cynara cardunculus var. scolymus]